MLAGIIDLSTEFNDNIDSSALAAELTADEIEQALESRAEAWRSTAILSIRSARAACMQPRPLPR